ncbi:MAG: formylglycine-generating enzyme family protein [Haliscomenobacter sp.]|nr:formylglycine-generating enzyme family protein [Haliscomenobacter sp.]
MSAIDYPQESYRDRIPDTDLFFEMIHIAGGPFQMGNQRAQIPSFSLGKYPVTQALWQAVMGDNPSSFQDPNRPVEQVSWIDVQTFLKKLNTRTGKTYRLPSEAEWEYVAQGGHRSQDLPIPVETNSTKWDGTVKTATARPNPWD